MTDPRDTVLSLHRERHEHRVTLPHNLLICDGEGGSCD